MRGLLAAQGIDVVGGAGSGSRGFQQIVELRPDVALIDIDLGEESGLELTRRLREGPGSGPGSRTLILISTHDEASTPI